MAETTNAKDFGAPLRDDEDNKQTLVLKAPKTYETGDAVHDLDLPQSDAVQKASFEVEDQSSEPPDQKPLAVRALHGIFCACCCCCPSRASVLPAEPDMFTPLEAIRRIEGEWRNAPQPPQVRDIWGCPGVGARSRLLCGGRFVTGPKDVDSRFMAFAWSSMFVPTFFFFTVSSSYLWSNYFHFVPSASISLAFVITFLLLTSFTDPGIIPRPALQLLVPGLQAEVAKAIDLYEKPGGRLEDLLTLEPNSEIMNKLEDEGYWWCEWCNMIQPPRAKHCKDCNACVLREDHHCPFLNNCIGQRNYAFFYGFIVSLCALAFFVTLGNIYWIAEVGNPCLAKLGECLRKHPTRAPAALIIWLLIIVVSLLLVVVILFAMWHLVLIVRGRTTREVLTGRVKGEGATLFAKRGRSLIWTESRIEFQIPRECRVARIT